MAIINIKGVKIVSELYPVRLIPVFKDYLWGGTKLKTVFNKKYWQKVGNYRLIRTVKV